MCDPASLALEGASSAFRIVRAVRRFSQDYQGVPEEVERLAQQADAWEKVMDAASGLRQRLQRASTSDHGISDTNYALAKQLELCKNHLYALSDELKMSPEAARGHNWDRVKKAFKKKELQESMVKLRQLCDPLFTITSIDSMDEQDRKLAELRSSLIEFRSNVDEHQARDEKRSILDWITKDCQWDLHTEHKANFKEGTLDAVLNSDDYYEWQNGLLNDEGVPVAPPTLWCHGPPGAGKSTLVYAIIERLREFYGKDAIIVFTYCRYENQEAQSTRNILACMVRTAVSEYDETPDYVLEGWKQHEHGATQISLSSLQDLLCQLLAGRRKSFIVVDALDELTDSISRTDERLIEPHRVLDEVITVMTKVNDLKRVSGQISCRALLTSREKCPDRYSEIEIREKYIETAEKDVRMTVEAAIDGSFFRALAAKIQKDANIRAEIVDRISKSANGVFLLATLQLGHLRRVKNLRELKDALKELPQDLVESHERSMQRIRNQPIEQYKKALAALSLVYHAKRPLPVEAVKQALAVRDGDEEFDEDGIDTLETLVNITAGLLAARSGNLAFVHHTVQEFLRRPDEMTKHSTEGNEEVPSNWFTDKKLEHGYIASQCLTFLGLKDFREPLDGPERELRAQKFPFLSYAIQNAGYHINVSSTLEDDTYGLTCKSLSLLREGVMPLGCYQEFLARLITNPVPIRVRAMQLPLPHFAVLCNFIRIARGLLTPENINKVATAKMETVLHFAARIHSKPMVEMILQKQANGELVNYSGKTPLDMILGAPLLKISFSIEDSSPFDSPTKVARAVSQVLPAILVPYIESRTGTTAMVPIGEKFVPLRILVDTLAGIEATNTIERIIEKEIKLSLSEEGEELARLFIGTGADLSSHQACRETPLQLATLYELPNLVKLLLEKGANPFLAWHCSRTAAEIAEMRGNEELAMILRSKEKEIDVLEASQPDENGKQRIPGRIQANYFLHQARKRASQRSERINAPLFSILDKAVEASKLNEKEMKAGLGSPEASENLDTPKSPPSAERDPIVETADEGNYHPAPESPLANETRCRESSHLKYEAINDRPMLERDLGTDNLPLVEAADKPRGSLETRGAEILPFVTTVTDEAS